ncbi:MAG TPA: M15 family metallopeptidase [Polyangiaceae bacterium]|jgi:hypothetical protein|nr:M15 family metallopeptidase [Polyangiaceae bacterium]
MTPRPRSPWLRTVPAGVLLALGLVAGLPSPSLAAAETDTHEASHALSGGCLLQEAKAFLKRSTFVRHGRLDGRRHERSVRYRVEHYGYIEGLGLEDLNTDSAISQAKTVRFMGHSVSVHQKIAPALGCVEKRIRKTCRKAGDRYSPAAVGGFRTANTFRGGEISNHLFGIALDIDPEKNPCCGCVSPWPEHPACQGPATTVFERTALPRCWIDAFERYGFYWLGRDPQLRDTMHFEFLGDPDRIVP